MSDPRKVEFSPSSDHKATLSDGRAVVSQYVLEVYQTGATTPFHTVDMGKPAPETDGLIRYDFSSGLAAWPLPGGTYESRVAAVGPYGTGRSAVSNQFFFCGYTVAPATVDVAASEGAQTVAVTTQAGCAWTATSNQSWVTLAPASGTASGSVTLTIATNTSTSSRSATLTLGGKTVTVTQAGAPCTYTLAPTSASFDRDGGSGSITVSTGTGCAWTVSSNVTWVSVVPTGGTGSGTVSFAVEPFNVTGTRTRSGAVTIGGRAFEFEQSSIGRSPSPPTNLRLVP